MPSHAPPQQEPLILLVHQSSPVELQSVKTFCIQANAHRILASLMAT